VTQILFAVESAESRSPPLNSERLVNFFTERQSQGAKSQTPLFGVPGLTLYATAGSGPIRGEWYMANVQYVVSGEQLYQINTDGTSLLLGSGILGTGVVSMSDNGTQLCIVNSAQGFIYSVAGGFQQITDPAFYPANTVTFFDGYFVFDRIGTNQFFLSSLYDGTTYNGLDFASAESSSGWLVGTCQNLQLLFLFKEDLIELWYDAGASDFPFQRYAGGVIDRGCLSPYTILKQDNAIFFLGNNGVFYRLQANVPIRVSNHAMEHIIAQEVDRAGISCLTYTWEGHQFVSMTLPTLQRTLVFDISTGKWHERESWDQNNQSLGRWRGNVAMDAIDGGQALIGDAFNGNIWRVDGNNFTEGGNTIRGLAFSVMIHADRKRVFISRFELDIQAGVGLTTGQGSNPQIMLAWSKDGGETFGSLQPWRSMGQQGRYLTRLRWMRMGQARQWCFCLSCTDSVRRVIIAAHADLAEGM